MKRAHSVAMGGVACGSAASSSAVGAAAGGSGGDDRPKKTFKYHLESKAKCIKLIRKLLTLLLILVSPQYWIYDIDVYTIEANHRRDFNMEYELQWDLLFTHINVLGRQLECIHEIKDNKNTSIKNILEEIFDNMMKSTRSDEEWDQLIYCATALLREADELRAFINAALTLLGRPTYP